jgi:hypothetical protein
MPDYGCNLDEAFQTNAPEAEEQQQQQSKKSKRKKPSFVSSISAPALPPEEYINFTQLGGASNKSGNETIIGATDVTTRYGCKDNHCDKRVAIDPDRQQYVRPKLIEAMKNKKPAWFGSTDAVEPSDFMNSFKAKETYADYGGNDANVEADFMSAFKERGVQKASAVPATPIVDVWKPLTPAGADTAFFNYLPQLPATQSEGHGLNTDAMQRRLKSIYERLDLLETARRENAQTEVMLFVISGVFFLFSLDLITRISK